MLGHRFDFEHLRRVADLDENEGLRYLDELLMGQLFIEGGSEGAYFFTHDKIRDVVYAEAGDARRRLFHRRALAVLQQFPMWKFIGISVIVKINSTRKGLTDGPQKYVISRQFI